MLFFLYCFLPLLTGYIIGINLSIGWEIVIILAGIAFLQTNYVRYQELGALSFIAAVFWMTIGIIIGDFITVFYFEDKSLADILNHDLTWLKDIFTPQ